MATYNGHRSWNAWNVSLWINNDEGLYREAHRLAKTHGIEKGARRMAASLAGEKTPDGARYMVGYADPYNCDKAGRGPAYLSLDVLMGDPTDSEHDADPVLREAARRADRIAERMAEREREYQEANNSGRKARELAREALDAGKAMVAQCRALRRFWAVRHGTPALPAPMAREAIRAALETFRSARESYLDARQEARDALETGHGWRCPDCDGWRDGYAEGVWS